MTPLADLFEILENEDKDDVERKFRVKVNINEIEHELLDDIVQFFDAKSGSLAKLSQKDKVSKMANPKVILFNVFQVTDSSFKQK